MPDHSIDALAGSVASVAGDAGGAGAAGTARTRAELRAAGADYVHVPRMDWRLGGRTVYRWRERLLAVAFISLGIGVLGAAAVETLVEASWAPVLANALMLLGMIVPIAWAFLRSRPAGLLRFRALDLLYAVALGVLLRVFSGWLDVVLGGAGAFPSYTSINGGLGSSWLLSDVLLPVAVAPVVEEFFFRAVLLVSLYTVLRRPLGGASAGVIAVVVSSAVFMLMHSLTGALTVSGVLGIGVLGVVCATLVMLTGRVWGAVLVHAVFNASWVVLALVGTALG
ncbi:CPBP family intramembrane glutamic endopeptidase [Microbacterium sp. C7(2022)]|uniref:CPBP family intramembrane glutamic endopeptidase n=1 Tax=Microbacterium sp. C7(2022) TaxID=2992759 RepID=UPI00237BDD5F|nr:CPBP family intramembrane glutamic endopeptidase [Microbacterium sp. C7(2022)]MDE0545404.1 CPBP family intramembrane metalloprotease [Microbacterium sp. C7(2022)]